MCTRATKKGTTTTFVLLLATCEDSPVVVCWAATMEASVQILSDHTCVAYLLFTAEKRKNLAILLDPSKQYVDGHAESVMQAFGADGMINMHFLIHSSRQAHFTWLWVSSIALHKRCCFWHAQLAILLSQHLGSEINTKFLN